jgi:hypothetical protein
MNRFIGKGAAVVCVLIAGCGHSPRSVLDDLYNAAPPSNVRVVHFESDAMGMDPSFAWELAPIDDAYLKKVIGAAGLKAPAPGVRPASTNHSWPAWWNAKLIEALPECYFDDANGLRRIWVDRKGNRLFIEFAGT